MFLVGLFVPLFSTPVMTLLQETVAPEMQGRVFSYVGIVMALSTPIGIAVFGPLADVISVQALLVIGGIGMIVVMLVAVLVPSGRAAIAVARAQTPGVPIRGLATSPRGVSPRDRVRTTVLAWGHEQAHRTCPASRRIPDRRPRRLRVPPDHADPA